MAKEFGRNRRVADLIQRELANLLERDRDGSESGMLTISRVDVSPDLKNAKVFVTCFGGDNSKIDLVAELTENAWHFRQHLAHSLKLRGVPKLKFIYDSNLERANRVTALIDGFKHEETPKHQSSESEDS